MISPTAEVDPTASIDHEASIADGCVIGSHVKIHGEVNLSKKVWIAPNSIIYGPAEIDENTYIDSHVIVGYPARKELEAVLRRRSMKPKISGEEAVKIGKHVLIRSNCTVYSKVAIGNNVRFGHNVMIRENVKIGDNTLVGTNVIIDGETKIGRGASIQTGAYISTYSTIEDFVFLGPNCVLTNDKYLAQKKCKLKGPTVKRGASIGANAVLFPGITIGKGAVVGAGAVVIGDVAARTIVAGVPAEKLRNVPPDWRSLLER